MHIHQDQVVGRGGGLGHCNHAVFRRVGIDAGGVNQFQCDFPVDGVVFSQKDSRAAVVLAQSRLGVLGVGGQFGRHDAVAAPQSGGEPEAAAFAQLAFQADVTLHQGGQPPGDDQAEAGAAVFARGRGVGLRKGFEQDGNLVGGNADARVFDLKAHQHAVMVLVQQQRAQGNGAVVGELDGVGGEVEQRLTQAGRISAQPGRNPRAFHFEFQPLGSCLLGDHGTGVVENRRQGKVGLLELQLAGFDLGQIENVVDDRQQMLGGGGDLVQLVGLFGRRSGAAHEVGETDDGVHRRADFVAHVGQERALGQIGDLGALFCFLQLRGALGHQFLEMMAVLVQFDALAFLLGDVFLYRDIVGDRAIRLADRRNDGELGILAAILAPVVKLALPRLAPGQGLPHRGIGLGRGIARLQDSRIHADRFALAIAGVHGEGGVDILDLALHVGDDDAFRALFHRLGQYAQLGFGGFAFRDVTDVGAEQGTPCFRNQSDRQFEREPAAIGVQPGHLDPLADDRRLAGLDEARHACAVFFAVFRRHDQVCYLSPQCLIFPVAENLFGAQIPGHHRAVLIHADHRIH